MIKRILSNDLYVLMEFLRIACFEGIRIPVVTAGTDTDDSTLTIVGRIFPSYDSSVATYAQDLTTCTCLPCSMVIVTAPVGTDVVLSCRVGDVIAGIGAVNLLLVVACHQVLPQWVCVLSVEYTEAPWTAAKLCSILVLTPAVVWCGPLVITCYTKE